MKKLLIPVAALSLFATSFAFAGGILSQPIPNAAVNGPYIGIHGGAAFINHGFDTGFDAGVQAGYRFTPNLRMEGAFTYLRNSFHFNLPPNNHTVHAHLNSFLFMANGIYDVHLTSVIDPFIGFGVGFDHLTAGSNQKGTRSVSIGTKFAYQAIAGVGFNVMPNTMVSVRYRFVGTANTHGLDYNILEASLDYFI